MNKQEIHKAIQFAMKEGFQKGKLEQKKEDIKIIDKTLIKLANVLHPSNQDYDWYKIIYTELKKEILGEEKQNE